MTKVCITCEIEKDESEYPSRGEHMDKCKPCIKKKSDKEYLEKNKDKINKKKKQFYQDNKNRIKDRVQNYRINNPEKKKAQNKSYRINNLIKAKINSMKTEDKNKGRDFNIDEAFIEELITQQDCKCYYCTIEVKLPNEEGYNKFNELSIDRKKSNIGHTKENCVISCLFCNHSKNASIENDYKNYVGLLMGEEIDLSKEFIFKDTKWASKLSNTMKKLCEKEGIENELTTQYIKKLYDKQKGKDYFTGVKMQISGKKFFPLKPSLDRLDNTKPHSLNNCVLVTYAGNMGRHEASKEDYIKHIETLRNL